MHDRCHRRKRRERARELAPSSRCTPRTRFDVFASVRECSRTLAGVRGRSRTFVSARAATVLYGILVLMGRGLGMVGIAFALVACGDSRKGSGNGEEPTWECSFSITLGGEITETIDADEGPSCSVTQRSGSGISVDIDPGGDAPSLALFVRDVTEGEVGEFAAFFEIFSRDLQQRFVAPGCSVRLTEHELVDTEQSDVGEIRTYRVVGSGTCAGDAVDANGSGRLLTLSDFEFRMMSIWEIP
jgi:hypothetical protein